MIRRSGNRFADKIMRYSILARDRTQNRYPLLLIARWRAPFHQSVGPLLEAAGRVRQHGVHLAGIRGEIVARGRLAALILRHLIQQPLELRDIAVDRRLELAVATIAVANLVERLLPLHRV